MLLIVEFSYYILYSIFTAIRIAKEFDVDITIDHGTESHLIVDEIVKANVTAEIANSIINYQLVESGSVNKDYILNIDPEVEIEKELRGLKIFIGFKKIE